MAVASEVFKSEVFKPNTSSAVSSLQQLNKTFLMLVMQSMEDGAASVASHSAKQSAVLGLPSTTLQSLRSLSDEALNRLANCPYALFELQPFESSPVASGSTLVSTDAQHRYAIAALFNAWHVAQSTPTRAQLWFCLDTAAVTRLRGLSAIDISSLAATSAYSLQARLGNQARYWPVMIRAAESADHTLLRLTQLFGRQVIAHSVVQSMRFRV